MNSPRVIAVSGGFDPLHIGHIRYLKEARALGDSLVVIANNDHWLRAKKGFVFMPEHERIELIREFPFVDRVVLTSHEPGDSDRSVCRVLEEIQPHVFANGGDRFADNIPELHLCNRLGIELIFNVGAGGKMQSSSNLVKESHEALHTVYRPWGLFKNHDARDDARLKTLHVNPGARLSLQRHVHRDELWVLVEGDALAQTGTQLEALETARLIPHTPFYVPKGTIHRITSDGGCVIVEVAKGFFDEEDIERFEDDYGRVEGASAQS